MNFLSKFLPVFLFALILFVVPTPVWAQAEQPGGDAPTGIPEATPAASPTELPKGEITGKLINQNDPAKPLGGLEIMLHILDQNQNQLGMLHGKSVADGSYTIADVPMQAGLGYAAAVVYEETTYFSQVVPAEAGKTDLTVDVPVYETTTDITKVRVDQMHVLFNFAPDGIEMQEVYALSNLGDRTVKNGITVPGTDGVRAALQFPLPEAAQYINFKPQAEGRFHTFPGGFADAAPLVPGEIVSQFLVSYLLPYSTPLTYELKTLLPVERVNLVVPKESGIILQGANLGVPEQVTAQNGQAYDLYSLESIPAGETIKIVLEGNLVIPEGQTEALVSPGPLENQKPWFLGLGALGMVLIGGGALWWVRSSRQPQQDEQEEEGLAGVVVEDHQPDLERILQEIAQLDKAYEAGEVDETTYEAQRSELKAQAKMLLDENKEKEAFEAVEN